MDLRLLPLLKRRESALKCRSARRKEKRKKQSLLEQCDPRWVSGPGRGPFRLCRSRVPLTRVVG